MAQDPQLVELGYRPGLATNLSDRTERGRWKDGNRVRFHKGLPQSIGGWQKLLSAPIEGRCRGMRDGRSLASQPYVALGTHEKLYVFDGSDVFNVTPVDTTGTLGVDPFDMTNTSADVTVNHTSHVRAVGDHVIFSGATAAGGITIDGEYTVQSVTSANAYVITHSVAATSTVSGGGASVDFTYELPIGSPNTIPGFGWGSDGWGEGGWGEAGVTPASLFRARTWSIDRWGEDFVACPFGGSIYYWDLSAGAFPPTNNRAAILSNAPITANVILVSPEDRHLIAFGAHDGSSDDPLNIAWSDTEDNNTWAPTSTNTAGSFRLDAGNEILGAIRTRGEILVSTDITIHRMVFTGPPFTFGRFLIGEACGFAGPNAAVQYGDVVYYMGCEDFYAYDGSLRVIPCDVWTHIFGDNIGDPGFNGDQRFNVYAQLVREFSEIWWYYPSADATDNDRYVTLNYESGAWSYGAIDRTAGVDRNTVDDKPFVTDSTGELFVAETGITADNAAMRFFLEGYDAEIDDIGQHLVLTKRIVPDFPRLDGNLEVSLKSKEYPQDSAFTTKAAVQFNNSDRFIPYRIKGRQLAVRIEGNDVDSAMRMAHWRADVSPLGQRGGGR